MNGGKGITRKTRDAVGDTVKRFLTWLKNKLIGGAEKYVRIAASKTYIRVKDGAAELVPRRKVPESQRTSTEPRGEGSPNVVKKRVSKSSEDLYRNKDSRGRGTIVDHLRNKKTVRHEDESDDEEDEEKVRPDRPRLTDEGTRAARISTLKDLHNEEVARRASRNVHIENDVLDQPSLIGADSEWEAELKIKLARGEDITQSIEANPQLDIDQVMSKLGLEWSARAGKNALSTQEFVSALNGNENSSSESSAPTQGIDTNSTGGTQGSVSQGYTSTLTGTSLPGTSSLSIDTGTSTMSGSTSSVSSSTSSVTGNTGVEVGVSPETGTGGTSGSTGGGNR